MHENFTDLFWELKSSGVPFDEAHSIIQKAAVEHYPQNHTAMRTYKTAKRDETFDEFLKDWKRGIDSFAVKAFYDFYPLNGATEQDKAILVKDYITEDKHGNKIRKEDLIQDAYIESFPLIDIEERKRELEKIMQELDEEVVPEDER